MKKLCLVFCALVLATALYAEDSYYAGEGGKNHTIMFAESTLENGIYDKSDLWVADKIKAGFISVLQNYGGFNCIDLNEAKNVLKVQKQLESGMYNDAQSIEIGKLLKAKEFVNIKTTRLPSGSYSISVSVFNVETGAILGMFSSPKTYESAEAYSLQAHYDCAPAIIKKLGVKLTRSGQNALKEEAAIAAEQAAKNVEVAKQNAALEAERGEQYREEQERRAKLEAEERERREAKEKEEAAAAQKALADKKARDAAAYAKAKQQNPFAGETYCCQFENGSRFDCYTVKFTSQNECVVTVKSTDSSGAEKSVFKAGSYSYGDGILSVSVRMPNDQVKHVQKINWKGAVTFKNGYKTCYYMIPVNSKDDAKKIRAEFQLK
ncbi:MAG: hypothetical protein IK015_07000 [Treponema sp.]|nr:hypothetical protein [Treponema sp.]